MARDEVSLFDAGSLTSTCGIVCTSLSMCVERGGRWMEYSDPEVDGVLRPYHEHDRLRCRRFRWWCLHKHSRPCCPLMIVACWLERARFISSQALRTRHFLPYFAFFVIAMTLSHMVPYCRPMVSNIHSWSIKSPSLTCVSPLVVYFPEGS